MDSPEPLPAPAPAPAPASSPAPASASERIDGQAVAAPAEAQAAAPVASHRPSLGQPSDAVLHADPFAAPSAAPEASEPSTAAPEVVTPPTDTPEAAEPSPATPESNPPSRHTSDLPTAHAAPVAATPAATPAVHEAAPSATAAEGLARHPPEARAELDAPADGAARAPPAAAEAQASPALPPEEPAHVSPALSPQQMVAEARARRDAVRKEVQKAQTRLTLLTAERKANGKKLERLTEREKGSRVPNVELPSVALRGGGDDPVTLEIRQIVKENKELEEAVTQHQEAKLHLEKLHNEKRDVARKLKGLRDEDNILKEQLQTKQSELAELQSLIKPSPMRLRYEAEVARLRREINSHNTARVAAERDIATCTKRLLRVRSVLGSFLKSQGFKPQQPLPLDDSEIAAKLASYVISLAERVQVLEKQVQQREAQVAEMESSAQQAAGQLRLLVSQRGIAQRKRTAVGLLSMLPPHPSELEGGEEVDQGQEKLSKPAGPKSRSTSSTKKKSNKGGAEKASPSTGASKKQSNGISSSNEDAAHDNDARGATGYEGGASEKILGEEGNQSVEVSPRT